jgi:hypothetical protein
MIAARLILAFVVAACAGRSDDSAHPAELAGLWFSAGPLDKYATSEQLRFEPGGKAATRTLVWQRPGPDTIVASYSGWWVQTDSVRNARLCLRRDGIGNADQCVRIEESNRTLFVHWSDTGFVMYGKSVAAREEK